MGDIRDLLNLTSTVSHTLLPPSAPTEYRAEVKSDECTLSVEDADYLEREAILEPPHNEVGSEQEWYALQTHRERELHRLQMKREQLKTKMTVMMFIVMMLMSVFVTIKMLF